MINADSEFSSLNHKGIIPPRRIYRITFTVSNSTPLGPKIIFNSDSGINHDPASQKLLRLSNLNFYSLE